MMEKISQETIAAIQEFLKSGESFNEIARRTNVSTEAVTAIWRRLKRETTVPQNKFPIRTISDLEKKQVALPDFLIARKKSCLRFKADLLAMLDLSIHQIQQYTGYSHTHIKSMRLKLRELEYLRLFDKTKKKISVSSLQYRLIESIFCASYYSTIGTSNRHDIDLSAVILAFSTVEQILHLPEYRCLLPDNSRLMLKDLLQSLYEVREKVKVINICPNCKCAYLVQAYGKQTLKSDCPFCLFKQKYQKEADLKKRKVRMRLSKKRQTPASLRSDGCRQTGNLIEAASGATSATEVSMSRPPQKHNE